MANRIHDAFDSIQADERLKETTKQFIQARSSKKSRFIYRTAFQGMLMFACMALVLAAGIGGYSWILAPVSYVSIDVNPSIELALNRLDRVVTAAAYNKEGEKILKGLSLKGKRYTDAIDAIMDDRIMQAYLAEDSEIVFTVAADSGRDEQLRMGVESCSGHLGHNNSQSISVDFEIVSEAHDSGLSLGKYYAWLELAQYDDSITVDECKNMSISKIHGLTKVHEQHENHSQYEEHDQNESGEAGEENRDEEDGYEGSFNEEEGMYDGCGQDEDNAQGSGYEKGEDDGYEQHGEYADDTEVLDSGETSMEESESSGHSSHHHKEHE